MSCLGFKNIKIIKGMFHVAWHPSLIAVLIWILVRYSKDRIVITSGYRREKLHEKDTGIHMTNPLRAFDMRSVTFKHPEKIAEDINNHWIYDPDRPWLEVALYHDTGHGFHFHVQVHPNTIWLKEGK